MQSDSKNIEMNLIKVMIVDDHVIVRDGFRSMLTSHPEIELVLEAENGLEAIERLQDTKVDVILMDIQMPKMKGIEATRKIIEQNPDQRIIAFTNYEEKAYVKQMAQAGACGYLLKDADKEEITEAIHAVASGETYFSRKIGKILLGNLMQTRYEAPSLAMPEDLTKREIEILKLLAEEMTNAQIGEKLCISPRTVDAHRRNMLHKIGAKNAVGLVKFAMHHGIVD